MRYFCRSFVALTGIIAMPWVIHAQDTQIIKAEIFLKSHPPMFSPAVELNFTDEGKRRVAVKLFSNQMDALKVLATDKSASIIPLIIPFLDYTTNPNDSPYQHFVPPPQNVDFRRLCEIRPALAAIASIPESDKALEKYALDKQYQLRYRLAAFHILRYINPSKFRIITDQLEKELNNSDALTQNFFGQIKDGSLNFDGIGVVQGE